MNCPICFASCARPSVSSTAATALEEARDTMLYPATLDPEGGGMEETWLPSAPWTHWTSSTRSSWALSCNLKSFGSSVAHSRTLRPRAPVQERHRERSCKAHSWRSSTKVSSAGARKYHSMRTMDKLFLSPSNPNATKSAPNKSKWVQTQWTASCKRYSTAETRPPPADPRANGRNTKYIYIYTVPAIKNASMKQANS